MTGSDYNSQDSISILVERTEYEVYLLEAIYEITEKSLFSRFPDDLIYALKNPQPKFFNHGRAELVVCDWRPEFIRVGAPLVFVTTFKILDMFIEWVLEENGFPYTFKFQEKIKKLNQSPVFPNFIELRTWLKERFVNLYKELEPYRGTIIHNKCFTVSDGIISVSSSKGNIVGWQIKISPDELRTLALSVVSLLRYVDGTWLIDSYREKLIRYHLDSLALFHGLPSLGQSYPFYSTVRIFSEDTDPRNIDPLPIHAALVNHYPDRDCIFDLRVLIVKENNVVDSFFFPWNILENQDAQWGHNINPDDYRCPLPNDINPEHYKTE